MSHKQAEHHPDLQPELPQVQPSSFVSQTPSQTYESVSHETTVQPSQVEPKGSSYLSISLAALLSEAPSSTGSKFDPYQAAVSESVLAEINNMVRNLQIDVVLYIYMLLLSFYRSHCNSQSGPNNHNKLVPHPGQIFMSLVPSHFSAQYKAPRLHKFLC